MNRRAPHPAGGVTSPEPAADEAPLDVRDLVAVVTDYAIFLLDDDGRVLTWNPGAERIKGWAAEEIIGQHFSIFYPEDTIASGLPLRLLERARREGRSEDEGWRIRRDGSRFWAQATLTSMRAPDGSMKGFLKITRDLTERKRAEEAASRLTRLADQEAIATEVLTKTVSSLFAIGLSLQTVIMEVDDQRVQRQLEDAINDLDGVITEVRRAVYARISSV